MDMYKQVPAYLCEEVRNREPFEQNSLAKFTIEPQLSATFLKFYKHTITCHKRKQTVERYDANLKRNRINPPHYIFLTDCPEI